MVSAAVQNDQPGIDIAEVKRLAASVAFGPFAQATAGASSPDGDVNASLLVETDKTNGVAENGITNGQSLHHLQINGNSTDHATNDGASPVEVTPNANNPSLPPPDVAKTIPCRFWPSCRYGDACAFAHDPSLGSAASPPNAGAPPVPALPTPLDTPLQHSPSQLQDSPTSPIAMSPNGQQQQSPSVQPPPQQKQQQQQQAYMSPQQQMNGFYYSYPQSLQPDHGSLPIDYYNLPPTHQFPGISHPAFYQGPPPPPSMFQRPPYVPYIPQGYYANASNDSQQQNSNGVNVPTAPRALMVPQNTYAEARGQPVFNQTAASTFPPSEQQPSSPNKTASPLTDMSSPTSPSVHTFFQTPPQQSESVMNASGITPAPMRNGSNSHVSRSSRRSNTMPPLSPVFSSRHAPNGSQQPYPPKKFSHAKCQVPCNFFSMNKCRNGDACPFGHFMEDGADAKLQQRNIIGVDGTSGDVTQIEHWRKNEIRRREQIAASRDGRPRYETYPGGYRDSSRFNGTREGARGRFSLSGAQNNYTDQTPFSDPPNTAHLPNKPIEDSRSRGSSMQRVLDQAEFPALAAMSPTTPTGESTSVHLSTDSNNVERAIEAQAAPEEASNEVTTSSDNAASAQSSTSETSVPAQQSSATSKLAFSFASAAAKGALAAPAKAPQPRAASRSPRADKNVKSAPSESRTLSPDASLSIAAAA